MRGAVSTAGGGVPNGMVFTERFARLVPAVKAAPPALARSLARTLTSFPRSSLASSFTPSLTAEPGRLLSSMAALESSTRADALLGPLRQAVHTVPSETRDVLHGRWLGHPAHPALVHVPLGAWISAAVLDLFPGGRKSAGTLVALGLAGAVPTAATGWADWAELRKPQMRVGLVHAAANSLAVTLYAASLSARLRGRGLRGRGLGYAGLAAVSLGGALGGHLSYRLAASVNHAEEVTAVVTPGWHPVGDLGDFPLGRPVRRVVDDEPLLIVRVANDRVHALADRCSHMSGPLSEGELEGSCVRCPWHGSLFRLSDGWNVGGPATAPQPAFETRVSGGVVEVRPRRTSEDLAAG